MKRRYAHFSFAAAGLVFAVAAANLTLRLETAERTNVTIAAARMDAIGGTAAPAGSAVDTPEAALARAIVLAHGEDYDRALRAYEALTLSARADIRLIAHYNLGNLQMRQAALIIDTQLAKARTLTELGKQNYRHVLDEKPDHWPSRYNLERALWLEPEQDEGPIEVSQPPSVTRPNGDKPELP